MTRSLAALGLALTRAALVASLAVAPALAQVQPSAPVASRGYVDTGLASATAATALEKARAQAAESLLLPKAGGTMTGPVALAPGSTGPVDGMTVGLRTLADKLADVRTIKDCARPLLDGDDIAPAIERCAADGVRVIKFPYTGTAYMLRRPFSLSSGSASLLGDANNKVELRLAGANDYFGIVGSSSAMSYDFDMSGFLFTKEYGSAPSTAGAVLKLTNVYRWSFNNNYVYSAGKIWRGLECYSCANGRSSNVQIEGVQERALYAIGGAAGGGSVGGWVVDNTFDFWNIHGANQVATDPENDGPMYFEDNFTANWITNIKADHYKGYLIFFKGTTANIVNNGLNLVLNPNAEASASGAGVVKFGAVRSSQVGGPASWISSWGLPAVKMSSNSVNIIARHLQINTTGAIDGVQDAGRYNTTQDIDVADLPKAGEPQTNAAVGILAGATGPKVERVTANGLFNAVRNDAGPNAGPIVSDIDFYNLRGAPLAGLSNGVTSISGVRKRGNQGAVNYFATAAAINLPPGYGMYYGSGSVTIDSMAAGYLGEERVIKFGEPPVTIRDQANTGLDVGQGGFKSRQGVGTNITISSNRVFLRVRWDGEFWCEQ